MIETVVALVLLVPAAPSAAYELATYTSRTECDIAARTVRIDAKGVRLRCIARDPSPDERTAMATRSPEVLP